ncbi:GTP 3',8-cyclase MoaA [Galbibacter marinus]|nr:GTP 3',8-cyclase MoaA [Galbibacter marinus]
MLIDNHNRVINYLRLAITDRCNLRCNYCMPAEGINFAKHSEVFSIEELCQLSSIMVDQGIDKIRLTGGEPFVRKDIMQLFRHLTTLEGLKEISVTTNATLIGPYIDELESLGIKDVNLSMDAITKKTFERITRRKQFDIVYENMLRLIEKDFKLRINCIVLEGQNEQEVLSLLELTKYHNVSVRFLEEMPFNGGVKSFNKIRWDYKAIYKYISEHFDGIQELKSPSTSTAINYKIPGHKGTFGIIPSFSRTFCGSCNRLRISATGDVITCLYGKPRMNIRELLRSENSTEMIRTEIQRAIGSRSKTGFEEQKRYDGVFQNSMTSIGG